MWHHPRTTSGQLPRRRNTIRPTGTCPHTRGRTDDSGTSMTVTAAPQHLFCVVLGGGVAQGTQALAGLGDGEGVAPKEYSTREVHLGRRLGQRRGSRHAEPTLPLDLGPVRCLRTRRVAPFPGAAPRSVGR